MRTDRHFWWTTLIRGFVALIAGSAILVVPDMTKTLLLLPIAVVMSIIGLAVYGIFDSVLVFLTSYMAASRFDKIALRAQGVVGISVGILLYVVFFDKAQLHWFLLLIVVQSLTTAVAEFVVARHAMIRAVSRWNLAAASVAFVFGCSYLYILLALSGDLLPRQISWLVYGYLVAFGIAQCLTAARMLYADHQLELADARELARQEM